MRLRINFGIGRGSFKQNLKFVDKLNIYCKFREKKNKVRKILQNFIIITFLPFFLFLVLDLVLDSDMGFGFWIEKNLKNFII